MSLMLAEVLVFIGFTIINIGILGITLKLYTEWNKVWRMTSGK